MADDRLSRAVDLASTQLRLGPPLDVEYDLDDAGNAATSVLDSIDLDKLLAVVDAARKLREHDKEYGEFGCPDCEDAIGGFCDSWGRDWWDLGQSVAALPDWTNK